MNEDVLLALGLCSGGILASGFYSGVETGAYQFHRARHRLRVARGERRARLVQSLTTDMTGFVVVCLIGTNLANALVSFSSTLAFEHARVPSPELVSTLMIGPILFMLGELFPKELYRRHADRLVYVSAPLLRISALIFSPLSQLVRVVNLIMGWFGLRSEESGGRLRAQERLRHAIAAGTEGGTLTAYQATLARNIFSLDTRTVGQVMIPLSAVDCLEAATTLEEARSFVRERGHSRYPVYQSQLGNVVGLVGSYDLIFEDRPGLTIRNYQQKAIHVDPRERVVDTLVRLRRARSNMAVVGAEGHALGIVTLKDLVEEITGELTDL